MICLVRVSKVMGERLENGETEVSKTRWWSHSFMLSFSPSSKLFAILSNLDPKKVFTQLLVAHIIHPPIFEVPTSPPPSLTLIISRPSKLFIPQLSTTHWYHTLRLSVQRIIVAVSSAWSGTYRGVCWGSSISYMWAKSEWRLRDRVYEQLLEDGRLVRKRRAKEWNGKNIKTSHSQSSQHH